MKTVGLVLAAAAALLVSTPSLAHDFTGPRVGVNVGVAGDEVGSTTTATLGVNAGYDFAIAPRVITGVTVEYQRSTEDFGPFGDSLRDVAVTARLGTPVTDEVLVYALGGYTNLGSNGVGIDGFRVGGGLEVGLGGNLSLNLEQRYSEYEFGVDASQSVVGLNYRF